MKSRYIKSLPANATVNSFEASSPLEPREIIICQNPPASLLQLLDTSAETAREYGVQRPSSPMRIAHYEKEIDKGELKTISMSVAQFRDGEKVVLATEDGAHRNKAALQKGWKGIYIIAVYQTDTLDNARVLASKFDSRISSRNYATTIMYVYGANPAYSDEHIKIFTSAMLHLLTGAGDDETKLGESFPMFDGKLQAHSFDNVCRVKLLFEEPVLKWFSSEFSISHKAKRKLYNYGVMTAMLQSYIAYGPEVKEFWSRYFSGCELKEGSSLQRLRDTVMLGKGGGGGRFLIDNYRMAVWAFLSETGRFGLSGKPYHSGRPYHMKFGYKPGYKPQRQSRLSPQVSVELTTVTSVKAA